MRRKIFLSLLAVLLLTLVATISLVSAQSTGAIRGTVYNDLDANGVCVGTGEPGQSGIPIDFVIPDGSTTLVLTSGDDGTYGLVAAGYGTWQVTVKPGTGWLVTSEQTRQVTIGTNNPEANNIDFCVVQVTEGTETNGAATLPASGAFISPTLLIVGLAGLIFLAAGALLVLKGRRAA